MRGGLTRGGPAGAHMIVAQGNEPVEETLMSATAGIAAWVARLRYDDLPADVVQVSKRACPDTIGVILAGIREPVTQAVHALLAEESARPAVQALRRRVTVWENPDIKIVNNPVDEGYVELAVDTRQGRHVVQRVTYPIGSSEIPLPWNELVTKFRDCAQGVLDGPRIDRAVACIAALEQQGSLAELVGILTPA